VQTSEQFSLENYAFLVVVQGAVLAEIAFVLQVVPKERGRVYEELE
jgi:hypothetical protein